MKLPYNANYELMQLPYSSSVFPSHLTTDPQITDGWFGLHEEEVFMFWPSSWEYPDGLLRDAFGVLACLPNQPYIVHAPIPMSLILKIREIYEKKNCGFDLTTFKVEHLEEKLEKAFSLSWPLLYTINEYNDRNDFMRVNYYELNSLFSKISQGVEIYCLKPESFEVIQNEEYTFETRILEKFQYAECLRIKYIEIDKTTKSFNVNENHERTREVQERELERITPMRPLW